MDIILSEAIRIAKLAGTKIKELREAKQYTESVKDGYELVTTADLVSNDIIKAEIYKVFCNHEILSEEDNGNKNQSLQQPTWIIDPIDGTVGYANDHYQVAVSIAYAVDCKVRYGVVYNPFLDEMYYASENSGAFLNGNKISVKDVSELKSCVIGTGFPHRKDDIQEIISRLGRVLPHIRDLRRLGSPALDICWVACGRMQGFYEGKLSPWDVAAAKLIAIEAGAEVGYYKKEDNYPVLECINGNNIIVSSPKVFDELKHILA
ncbi:myo-inositol-1(or 4)-monophosphatase [Anaerosolibacter carboniphilus]|uniref:Inositol-1-monophosphatase n=1 Tax=Anaerosolibacter carboniphilus TaxID=1417629 RepID=A0A841L308_9FIRM|nr:inositol monophosphatase family protein [Anaerosolibacter carboniphilus]MBB6217532.1 myo-inositol-1(or 4)-monophosphatase [Anaerosolibacter carboniphilus]